MSNLTKVIDMFSPFKASIQVSSRHRPYISLVFFILCVFACFFIFFYFDTVKTPKQNHLEPAIDFSQELKQNLTQLQALQQEVIHHTVSSTRPQQLVLRQHAPSRVYQSSSTVSNNISSGVLSEEKSDHWMHTIVSGEIISAVLETALNSELPGLTRAVVTRPVYAFHGRRLLIPAGSRVIGEYQQQTLEGQRRLGIIWQELILPSGRHLRLETPSTDPLGRTGQAADAIQHHFWERFGTASVLSVIGAAISPKESAMDGQITTSPYQQSVSNAFQDNAAGQLQLPAQGPTLLIRQGASIDLIVKQDLTL